MRRKFFLRRACQYFVMLLLPTTLLFSVFFFFSTQNEEGKLLEKSRQTIQSVAQNCDMVISSVAEQNNLLTTATRMSIALRRMLNENNITYSDSIFMSALRTTLDSITNAIPELENILIWMDDAPRVFSSTGASVISLDNSQSIPWLELYRQMEREDSYVIAPNQTVGGIHCVTIIRRLLLQKGCTVVNINTDKWGKKLQVMLQQEKEHILLINSRGQLLMQVSNGSNDLMAEDQDIEAILQTGENQWIQVNGEKYLVSLGTSNDLTIAALVPEQVLVKQHERVISFFVMILLVNLVVVVFLAYLTTKRICNQMLRMIDTFDQAMKGIPIERDVENVKDEYDVIMNNIMYMYLKENAMKTQIREEQYQKMHAEFMALQLQINPHFLYNTLQTLDICIRAGNMDRFDLSDMIHDLSNILKYALSDPQETVTLAEEIKYLRDYAAVQKFRFENRFVIYYEVNEDCLQCSVFRMMLQPLVENSMIHGLNQLAERGYIWVSASRLENRLRISIRDSGVGMTEEERKSLLQRINDEEGKSIGLKNLNSRLVLRYGESSRLQIDSSPVQGTNVYFDIPYQIEDDKKVSQNSLTANADTIENENSFFDEEIE